MQVPKTELFADPNEHAMYAVDLITRVLKALEPQVDYDLRKALGDELHHEACHAIGWDIDWERVYNEGR